VATTTAEPKPKPDVIERKPLLEISTLAPERPTVTIDDVQHEFRLMQDFGAIEHQEFVRDSRRYDALWSKETALSKAEQKLMEKILDGMFTQILADPQAAREQLGDRLTGAIQREILVTFTNAPLLMAMAHETDNEAENNSTTES
jgi:hypothetical protein